MRYMRIFGFLAIAAAALMAFAGPASATLTEGTGDPVEAGDIVHASAEGVVEIHKSAGSIKCKKSTIGARVLANGGTTGEVLTLTFEECLPDTVKVIKKGHLTIASDRDVISTGAEITVQTHRTVLGFPITTHCTYLTNNTKLGKLTESNAAGHPMATIHIKGAQIPVVEPTSNGPCGPTAEMTGAYTVEIPAFLDVD